MKKSLLACALAFSSFSLVAHADDAGDGWIQDRAANAWSKIEFLDVHYGDLNLSHRAGADVMLKRIRFAAARVCGGAPDLREIRERVYFKRCVRDATHDAVEQVDAPLVTARFIDDENIEWGTASRW